MSPEPLNYEAIEAEARVFALGYRKKNAVPVFPSAEELAPYRKALEDKYAGVILLVTQHTVQFESWVAHGVDHLRWVSSMAGFIAESECNARGISGPQKQQVIETALLAGLLHDVDRHLGFGEDHMTVGAATAERILNEAKVENNTVKEVVGNHDRVDYLPSEGDLVLQIAFGAVFDADHLLYGTERETTFWDMKRKKGVPPEKVISDYNFLPPLRDAWRTSYGKQVGPKLIDFALAIARHVEETFSTGATRNS